MVYQTVSKLSYYTMISYFAAITKGLLVEWKLKVLSWLDVDLCIGNISLVAHREKLTWNWL